MKEEIKQKNQRRIDRNDKRILYGKICSSLRRRIENIMTLFLLSFNSTFRLISLTDGHNKHCAYVMIII